VLGLALRRGVDVVYVNSPPDILSAAALPARMRRIPVILDIHDPMPELFTAKGRTSGMLRRLLELQESAGMRMANALVTVHEPMRRLLTTRNPGRDIAVVMNVPDTSQLLPLPDDPESRLLVFAGTVAFRYGLDDVVEAMSMVRDEIPGLRLRVIGEGEDLDRLRELASRLEVPVEFTGAVPWDQVRSAQAGAWAGVNVPKPDTLGELSFSNKIVEWVAMGLPVIASRTSTLLAYFPEESLEYVEGGNPESVAQGLLRIDAMSSEERSVRIEEARRALSSIAWPVQRDVLLELTRSVVQSG
jgi:glycosyltransferase involved in cell wall biosynthesis